MVTEHDKQIVRELAKQYMALVTSEKQQKMIQRKRDTNDLKQGRPPVLISEIPWYQMNMDGELTLHCEDDRVRGVERFFREALFYFKHFKADNNYEPFFRVRRAVSSTGIGIEQRDRDLKRTDDENNIVSRDFEDVLADESVLDRMHLPEFTCHPDIDAKNMEFYTELLGDSKIGRASCRERV